MAESERELCSQERLVNNNKTFARTLIESAKQERQSNREYYEQYLKNNGKDSLYNLLLQRDPDAALSTHQNNTKRVIRYLDILSSFEGTLEEYKKAAIGKNYSKQ